MMKQLNNWFDTLNTYADMSPDLAIRREVNQWTKSRGRRSLSLSEWSRLFSSSPDDQEVMTFVYQRFSQYSGLDFGRIRPTDRLHADLNLALVCWFDWVMVFCDDFEEHFHIDISDRFDEDDFETIGGLVGYLSDQVMLSQPQGSQSRQSHLRLVKSSADVA